MDLNELIGLDFALLARTAKHENEQMWADSKMFEADYQEALRSVDRALVKTSWNFFETRLQRLPSPSGESLIA